MPLSLCRHRMPTKWTEDNRNTRPMVIRNKKIFLSPIFFAKREKNEDYGVDALDSGMGAREQIGG